MIGCGGGSSSGATSAAAEDPSAKSEGVMTYAEYDAAELNSGVTIEAYVQGKQSWWDNKATLYTQDGDGAYFIYEMPMSEEEYKKLTDGTKIKVQGFKSEWSGEIEIVDATYEIEEGNYIAEAKDVTDKLGTDELVKFQNQKVAFKGMTVEQADDSGAAFLYNWDGSGQEGDDLYFNVSLDGKTYSFTVESYLTGADTEVYKAVKELKVGDKVDLEGFLYWYEGPNPHITAVKAA
jgi:DNA/RNA endonuclease YhcR with UshA esterase domain